MDTAKVRSPDEIGTGEAREDIIEKLIRIIKAFCKTEAHGKIVIQVRNHEIVGVSTETSKYVKM